ARRPARRGGRPRPRGTRLRRREQHRPGAAAAAGAGPARGQRAVGAAPRNHGPDATLAAALTPAGGTAPMAVEGAAAGAVCAAYLREVPIPALGPGQGAVLDDLSAHKAAPVRALVAAAGRRLLVLPASSPDFTPIELAFAKLKEHPRRAAARTDDALVG